MNYKMNFKPYYQSKTFWFNVLTIITVVATFYGYVPNQGLADQASGILIAVSPLINLILRFITTKGLY